MGDVTRRIFLEARDAAALVPGATDAAGHKHPVAARDICLTGLQNGRRDPAGVPSKVFFAMAVESPQGVGTQQSPLTGGAQRPGGGSPARATDAAPAASAASR
jgi:hypothetical protein